MNTVRKLVTVGAAASLLVLAGCTVRPVVKHDAHHHPHAKAHVVYHAKQSQKHCWRHKGHWDCK